MNATEMIKKHNDITKAIEELENQLHNMSGDMIEAVGTLPREEAIRLYPSIMDSFIKFEIFKVLRNK